MKLVHLSDIHLHDGPIGDTDAVAQFRLALAHVEKHHSDAEAIVITGDLTHTGAASSYETLREILVATPLKIHLLLGNHDHRGRFRAAFPDRPADENGFIQHVAEAGGYRLVMLDTVEAGTHAGLLGKTRLAWLSRQLADAAAARAPVLLFMHHNPLPVGVWASDVLSLEDRDDLCAILRRHRDTVRHIFFGHTHYSLSGALEGVPFSAPRTTSHPCWPEFSGARRMGFGPIAPNYNLALIDARSVVVHTIDFMLEDRIRWLDVPDEVAWARNETPVD